MGPYISPSLGFPCENGDGNNDHTTEHGLNNLMYLKEPNAMPNTCTYLLNVVCYYSRDFREGFNGNVTFELDPTEVEVSFPWLTNSYPPS